MKNKERIFTREHAREYSLFRLSIYHDIVNKELINILGVSLEETCSVFRGESLVEEYYQLSEIKKLFSAVAKKCQDEEQTINDINEFLRVFSKIKQYFTREKTIKKSQEFEEFVKNYGFCWAWIGIVFAIPTLPVSKRLKKLAFDARAATQEYNERPEIVIKEFLEKNFPKLKGNTRFVLPKELKQVKENLPKILKKISERKKGFIFYQSKLYTGDLEKMLKKLNIVLQETDSFVSGKAEYNEHEIKGQSASKSKATGRVKIVSSEKDIAKVKDGDILVTTMTMPKYIVAMKKAAAFVTDEGGMTCHAAILAREMKKPCVIGTKIATKILKDDDLVEVDADNGIIKIIKNKSTDEK